MTIFRDFPASLGVTLAECAGHPRVIKSGLLGLGIAALAIGSSASAATVTTTVAVTATVQATCLVSATSLGFGPYSGVQVDATSTVSVTCTNTTPYSVGLNAGLATAATVTTRKMTGPASAVLSYSLFSDTARTTNWGSTVTTDTLAGVGTGAAQSLTIYGRVPASQFVTPGAYTDTITATVTF